MEETENPLELGKADANPDLESETFSNDDISMEGTRQNGSRQTGAGPAWQCPAGPGPPPYTRVLGSPQN